MLKFMLKIQVNNENVILCGKNKDFLHVRMSIKYITRKNFVGLYDFVSIVMVQSPHNIIDNKVISSFFENII